MVIIAPPDSPVGRWAGQNDWPLLITDENDPVAFAGVREALRSEDRWLEAQRKVMTVAAGQLSTASIHGRLLEHIGNRC